ncbi:2,3,4,5-tetrahydropyridine-2,6-dicarboxylate N-succinyltransferase [Ideonella sp. A 288]|uniref:2,3,4,5-tetrahydropyridine-2,6-dicarboxylate N-succinyltransferase n=1 Tax=Ideonella sp. A 288 TaxID=1962181 RepID=UPI000B4B9A26|nr:2,3,4,5-tetrahydropyridine-2,6-dicarboxylate N-succinyltransferase [Ideonella sp. A 288]
MAHPIRKPTDDSVPAGLDLPVDAAPHPDALSAPPRGVDRAPRVRHRTGARSARFARHAATVEAAWASRDTCLADPDLVEVIDEVIAALDDGTLRAADRRSTGRWVAHQWVLQAVVLSFGIRPSQVLRAGDMAFFDHPGKFEGMDQAAWQAARWRVLAPTAVKRGCYLGQRVFLLPSFVNTGAFIDDDTMIDGFANIGTCAQIGKRVHISTCVGIGGIAEPMQSRPVIIEDDCFVGANSSVVEGMVIEQGAVIGMGVHLGQSTKILDRATGRISYGRVPAGAVVVPGALPSADGTHSTACAVIVKRVDAATRAKVGINALLRS